MAVALLGAPVWVHAQSTPQLASPTVAAGGTIRGLVKSGNMPIPGTTVTAMNTLTGQKAVTGPVWTAPTLCKFPPMDVM